MALAISDLQYDLLTLTRTYDRANDFERRDEYERLAREIQYYEKDWEDTVEELEKERDTLLDSLDEETGRADTNKRLLDTIAGIARDALASTEDRDDIDDNEAALLDALSNILSHAEA